MRAVPHDVAMWCGIDAYFRPWRYRVTRRIQLQLQTVDDSKAQSRESFTVDVERDALSVVANVLSVITNCSVEGDSQDDATHEKTISGRTDCALSRS